MSLNLNRIIMGGRLTKDVELKTTVNGKPTCTFTVASTFGWGDKAKTNYIFFTAYDKVAENISRFCEKGTPIYVEGHIDTYSRKDGEKTTYGETKICDNFQIPVSKADAEKMIAEWRDGDNGGGNEGGNNVGTPPVLEEIEDADLPF